MKKPFKPATSGEPCAEYDFSRGARGKYARRYRAGSNVVMLEPDVAKAFPSPESVNRSLRALVNLVELQAK